MTWNWNSPAFDWALLASIFAQEGADGIRVWLQSRIPLGAEDPSQGNGCIVIGWRIFNNGMAGFGVGETNVTTYQQHPLPTFVGQTCYIRVYYSC